jgi:hypothetical protein
MTIHKNVLRSLAAVALAAAVAPVAVSAQLASASATTLGLAGNVTARARGIAALSANPAGLGMPGSGFTLALLPLQVRPGLGPITSKDLADFQGEVVPAATRQTWLDLVRESGQQSGTVGAEVTELALAVGRFGLQASTIVQGSMSLAPDAVEAILFGNAGRTGQAANITVTGSSMEAFAVTTVGGSFALPLSRSEGAMALGATLKYSMGHGVLAGEVESGSFTADPIKVTLDLPLITIPDEDADPIVGSGLGLDLGFQMKQGKLGLGVAVLNALNTFEWDQEKLVYRPGTASWDASNSTDDFDEQPISGASTATRALIEDMTFDPALSVGVAYDVSDDFTVSGDLQNRFGEGMQVGPKFHLGGGAEYRGLKVLHLRAGAAAVTGGAELAAGASLVLGPVSLSAAGGTRTGEEEDTQLVQFTLSFGGR